ncbi:MAG TPA: L,D-transpeptidase family protein [Beijerinckiaceae bacterium]|nr:L,D-transpeptidase family protein [Beijerinckiaceae bacterium]
MRVCRHVPKFFALAFAASTAPALAQSAPFFNAPPPAPSYVYVPAPAPAQSPTLGRWAPRDLRGQGVRPSSVYAPDESDRTRRAILRSWRPLRLTRRSHAHITGVAGDRAASFTPETAALTRRAADRYARIVDAGGWPKVPTALRPGSRGQAVATLRRRLAIEGDLNSPRARESYDYAADSERWDSKLTAAVKRFQARVGLPQSGVVAGATLAALNVPARMRLRQLQATANRLAAVNFRGARRYVAVNIPSESVQAVQNGEVVHRYIAVVGSPEHHSPQIAVQAQAINLNPTWTVPASIIKNEIIPKMRKDPGYLSHERIRVLDYQGHEINAHAVDWNSDEALHYILRQDSGPHDALGRLRIDMPNNQAVYMHDTNERWLFKSAYRFKSHGCVRVKDVYGLATWLLQGTPGAPYGRWDQRAIEAGIANGEQRAIKLANPVPVIWVYMTGWADADGVVHFRNDVYGKDSGAQNMVHAALR